MSSLLKNTKIDVKNKEGLHRHAEFSKNSDSFNSCLNFKCFRHFLQTHCVLGIIPGAGDAEVMPIANCCF